MKKSIFRLLCFFAVLMIIVSTNTQAIAVEPRASNFIESQGSSLTRTTGTKFDIYFTVNAGQMLDEIGVFMIQLTKSTDQQTWYREEVFYCYDYPEFLCENACGHAGTLTYTGTRGYYYRANIVFYAKDGSETERTSMYTNTIYIPLSGNGGRTNE